MSHGLLIDHKGLLYSWGSAMDVCMSFAMKKIKFQAIDEINKDRKKLKPILASCGPEYSVVVMQRRKGLNISRDRSGAKMTSEIIRLQTVPHEET